MVQYNSKAYNTNMLIKQSKSNWTKVALVIAGALVAVSILSAGIYALTGSIFGWDPLNGSPESSAGNNPPSKEQVDSGSSIKENSIKTGGSSGSDQPMAPTVQDDGRLQVQLDITGVNRLETVTRVGVLISALDQAGTCTITATSASGETLYSSSAGVQAMSNTSTCKGFDIPNSVLPNTGYVIVVNYSSNDRYGTVRHESS